MLWGGDAFSSLLKSCIVPTLLPECRSPNADRCEYLPGPRPIADQAARGDRRLGKITVNPDPVLTKAFQMGPQDCETVRATELGFQKEANLEEIVRYYIDDYLEG